MRSEWEFCTLFLHFTFFYKAKFFWKNKELGERLSNIMEKRRNLEKITKNRWEILWENSGNAFDTGGRC